ncbi:exopolyphosphatase [Corynebacterium choanae]|uniref:Guanosine-5'-triphosphate,3'-diphosphate pyrophosphatase n=1 Tax=Corynebacterium choanae TaxID=1862358 RepID=A0A3G6J5P2_9CORY|nr:Ppx/GppA phosphatase family protein [Corynebacterium choanae]AZA13152.1 Guanosine-5'-triphosphate,3'-diphosphate pyrophosphatase [Corynebacterium choanae]
MTRLAAVDCGTNAIRLLVSEYSGGKVRDIHRALSIVRLGEGVDATGRFTPEAIARTRQALERYVEIMRIERVEHVVMVATSATRDAQNRAEFFAMTSELLGQIQPGAQAEVITGEREAALSFAGAVADLQQAQAPYCVIDLGGGSTEFVVGEATGQILGAYSANMGCVRLTERILRDNPPTKQQQDAARRYVQSCLDEVEAKVDIAKAKTFVGCAGTFTTLSAIAQGLESYETAAIHGSVLRFPALDVLAQRVIEETSEKRATNPVVHPGRADVLGGGSVVVQEILHRIEALTGVQEIIVSEKDILDGLILELVASLQDREATSAE